MSERKPIDEQTHLAAVQRLAQTPLPADLRARVGGKVGRNLYFHSAEFGEADLGRVDTTALAKRIVTAVNIYTDASSDQRRCPATSRHYGQCDLYQGHHQPDDPTSRHLTGAVRWADPTQQAAAEPLTSFAGSAPDLAANSAAPGSSSAETGADPRAFQFIAGNALTRYYEGVGWYDLPDPHEAGAAVVEALLSDEKLINYVRRSLTEGEEPDGAG